MSGQVFLVTIDAKGNPVVLDAEGQTLITCVAPEGPAGSLEYRTFGGPRGCLVRRYGKREADQ